MKYSIRKIDTCLPSYFQGCDLPYIQVVVDGSTTKESLQSSLIDEYKSGYIANESQLQIGDAGIVDTMIQDEQIEKAIREYCSSLPVNPFPDLDVPDDESEMGCESVYSYYVIEKE